jgi:DNA polymerase III delta prime subunit
MKLRIAPSTERFIAQFNANPSHAVLLTGGEGTGLFTLAEHISAASGHILNVLKPESKTSTSLPTISVERIRQLYVETRSRLNGDHFVIIDDADTMNHVAQNALLKLLEEPNPSVHFILTSHSPDKLLATIRSRTQTFAVPPIDALESRRLLKGLGVSDTLTEQRLLYVAEGLPAELTRLSRSDGDFKLLAERVQKARQFAEGTPYQRLAVILSMKEDRQGTLKLIEMITMLLRRSINGSPERSTLQLIDRLLESSELIRANGNARLQLCAAVV